MEDTKTLMLRKPVKIGDEVVDRLQLREPTAGEVDRSQRETVKASPVSGDILLISLVSGVAPAFVEKIGYRDFNDAREFLKGFFPASPETGGTA